MALVVTIDVIGGPYCGENWEVPKSNGKLQEFIDVPVYDDDGTELIEWCTYGLARLDEADRVTLVWLYMGVKADVVGLNY